MYGTRVSHVWDEAKGREACAKGSGTFGQRFGKYAPKVREPSAKNSESMRLRFGTSHIAIRFFLKGDIVTFAPYRHPYRPAFSPDKHGVRDDMTIFLGKSLCTRARWSLYNRPFCNDKKMGGRREGAHPF